MLWLITTFKQPRVTPVSFPPFFLCSKPMGPKTERETQQPSSQADRGRCPIIDCSEKWNVLRWGSGPWGRAAVHHQTTNATGRGRTAWRQQSDAAAATASRLWHGHLTHKLTGPAELCQYCLIQSGCTFIWLLNSDARPEKTKMSAQSSTQMCVLGAGFIDLTHKPLHRELEACICDGTVLLFSRPLKQHDCHHGTVKFPAEVLCCAGTAESV